MTRKTRATKIVRLPVVPQKVPRRKRVSLTRLFLKGKTVEDDEAALLAFQEEVAARFEKARPAWSPPHRTIYAVAKMMGATAIVNGVTESKYDARDVIDGDDEPYYADIVVKHPTNRGRYIVRKVGQVRFDWLDLRRVVASRLVVRKVVIQLGTTKEDCDG